MGEKGLSAVLVSVVLRGNVPTPALVSVALVSAAQGGLWWVCV